MKASTEPIRRALAIAHALRQLLSGIREDDPSDDEARIRPLVERAHQLADDLVKTLRQLAPVILAGAIVIRSSAPPLSPGEAVKVLRGSHSPADMTNFRAAPTATLPPSPPPRVADIPTRPTESVTFRPLNCCDVYQTPLPYPTVVVRKER